MQFLFPFWAGVVSSRQGTLLLRSQHRWGDAGGESARVQTAQSRGFFRAKRPQGPTTCWGQAAAVPLCVLLLLEESPGRCGGLERSCDGPGLAPSSLTAPGTASSLGTFLLLFFRAISVGQGRTNCMGSAFRSARTGEEGARNWECPTGDTRGSGAVREHPMGRHDTSPKARQGRTHSLWCRCVHGRCRLGLAAGVLHTLV